MQPTELTLNKTSIGELVSQDWRKAEVFKKYGIDFCCGGKRTVAEACGKKGIDPALVEAELQQVEKRISGHPNNFNQWELDFLVDYIVNNHHKYVSEAVPFLDELSAKVSRVHGDRHPELIEIEQLTQDVIQELTMHMPKEEMILFPYVKQLVHAKRNSTSIVPPPFGTIANPINMMEAEHTSAGGAMEAIEELSNRFTPPADACMSYQVLFAKLKEFQQDLHQHIHLENNILFPKALKLEEELIAD
ncbi:MAG TPA: iron-sulfur cluster repair di-iron protein [Cyclobacteriaceae bacterium]|nr:iron-sulfur cluster repair di-iron protein [Cyclobacteriaceae bacterium]